MSAISGGSSFRWTLWKTKKNCQFRVRQHLSHALAAFLAVLVVVREFADLRRVLQALNALEWVVFVLIFVTPIIVGWYGWTMIMRKRVTKLAHVGVPVGLAIVIFLAWKHLADLVRAMATVPFLDWLILMTVVGTISAAIWELWGNKLRTSPQEVKFTAGLRFLLAALEAFSFETSGPAITRELLLEKFLEISRGTLCGNERVDACIMMPTPDLQHLRIEKQSKGASYPVDKIPLQENQTGAAGLAFKGSKLVYVPDKEWREVWSLSQASEQGYKAAAAPEEAWVPAYDPKQERFKSLLCVPVKRYSGNNQWKTGAVLNFTTDARDPFMPRDFLMAECMAAVLSQGWALKDQLAGKI